MTYSVTGTIDGVVYTANVGDPNPDGETDGLLSGSPNVVNLLHREKGNPTPSAGAHAAPSTTLDLNDEVSILRGLHAWTSVLDVSGDAPDIFYGRGKAPVESADVVH